MRFLGVDYGRRRIGLAVSDASALLARPWRMVPAGESPAKSAEILAGVVRSGDDETSDLAGVVIGLPRRLNGEDTDQTAPVRDFARRVGELTGLAIHLQDERLSSHEADARLAVHERDWRRRKAKLDAAAAAVILQDFLDERPRSTHTSG